MSATNGGGPADSRQPLVPLGPLPTVCQVSLEEANDGTLHVVVRLHDPSGVRLHFFAGDAAQVVGEEMVRLGRAAAAGLHLPN